MPLQLDRIPSFLLQHFWASGALGLGAPTEACGLGSSIIVSWQRFRASVAEACRPLTNVRRGATLQRRFLNVVADVLEADVADVGVVDSSRKSLVRRTLWLQLCAESNKKAREVDFY